VGTSGPRKLFELLFLSKQAGFSFRNLPGSRQAARFGEVTRAFTTPESFAAGIRGSGLFVFRCSIR